MRHPAGIPERLRQLDRTLVMGVVNVTPDSFSDGGKFDTFESAVAHGHELARQGADLIDIGGESTRPGAQRISAQEEIQRVVPVIRELAVAGLAVSVDTMRAEVASEAIAAGACLVNDVSAGQADPEMFPLLADCDVAVCLMHWRGHSDVMAQLTDYQEVALDVALELAARVAAAETAGISAGRIVLDPGIGFAKTPAQNWPLLAGLNHLVAMGFPLLIGTSRKRFLGELLGELDAQLGNRPVGEVRPTGEREFANTALTALLASSRHWAVRVHDVAAARAAIAVVEALRHA